MLLAIDTSAGTSVDLRGDNFAAGASSADTMAHAEVIGDLISQVFERAAQIAPDTSVTSADVTGVVAGIGPGPFTGLRVGLAAASAFAVGRNIPLLPVISHDGMALHALEESSGPVIIVTDARRKELYWSIYTGFDAHGLPVRVAGPALSKPDEVPTQWQGIELTVWGFEPFEAGLLNMIAQRKLAAGMPFEPFEPLYLRSPDVTMSNGPKRVVQ